MECEQNFLANSRKNTQTFRLLLKGQQTTFFISASIVSIQWWNVQCMVYNVILVSSFGVGSQPYMVLHTTAAALTLWCWIVMKSMKTEEKKRNKPAMYVWLSEKTNDATYTGTHNAHSLNLWCITIWFVVPLPVICKLVQHSLSLSLSYTHTYTNADSDTQMIQQTLPFQQICYVWVYRAKSRISPTTRIAEHRK